MKQKLLSLIALAGAMFMSTGAMAQWTEPVEVVPAIGDVAAPEDGGVYFLYNEATDLYLGAGNDWGTHVVATTVNDSYPATFWNENIALSSSQAHALPIKLTKTEGGNWYLIHMGTNKGGDKYLTSEDGNSWIDGNEGRRIDFIITATTGGYTIQATNTVGASTFLGIAEGDATHDEFSTLAINVMNTIAAGDARAVWQFIGTNYAEWNAYPYKARVELYETLMSTLDLGFTVDTSAATAVYNNPDATKEQIEAATAKLKYDINAQQYEAAWAGASEDNPMDVTEDCLTNPNFDSNIDGWTITVGGQNLQWQQRQDGSFDESKNWVQITNFIEAWIPSPNTLTDGTISQTVYGLPAGKYVLECDAMATRQGGLDGLSPEDAVEGAYIFIQGESHEVREPIKAPDYQPKHWSVVFVNDDSHWLTFGLKVENTTANWISADNFKLTYYGKTEDSPELVILKDVLKRANELAEQVEMNNIEATDNINVSEEARQALNSAISQGESAASGSDAAAQTAATEAINNAITAVNESKAVYAQFKSVYESGNETLNHLMDNNQWPDLQGEIETFLEDDLKPKFEAGALTADQLEEYENKISDMIHEFISDPSQIHEGDDLTFLLANPHFKQGNGKEISEVPGWIVNNGSMTELRALTHNIEAWHKHFDISQTLPNMPAGVYDITLQGFTRHDDGGVTDKTWLYGGISKVQLISLNDDESQMRDEPLFSADTPDHPALNDTNYDATGSVGYKCNGMSGAYYWFKETNPNTGEPYYTNHVEVVLDRDGDLTIGIHCEADQDWVIFDNFGIKYAGMKVEKFAEMVEEKQLELSNLVEDTEIENPTALATEVNTLVAQKLAIDASSIDNADDALAAIAEIEEAINKVKESVAAYNSVGSIIEYFESLINTSTLSPSTDFQNAVDAARSSWESGYATIAAMKDDEATLAGGWAAAVASEVEEGDDATALILNPDYDGLILDDGVVGGEFWTNAEGNPGFQTNFLEVEFFSQNFNHYQTLKGIKPGYYTVSVEGYYRYGDYNANEGAGTPGAGNAHADGTEELNAVMYVQTSAGNDGVALKSIFEGAQSAAYGVGSEVQADGFSGYIPNNMEAAVTYLDSGNYTNSIDVQVGEDGVLTIGVYKETTVQNDWTIFTGWKLKYLGTTAPDAVEGIEAQTAGISAIYGIDGRQQNQLRRGVNIVRQSGKVNKVLVK